MRVEHELSEGLKDKSQIILFSGKISKFLHTFIYLIKCSFPLKQSLILSLFMFDLLVNHHHVLYGTPLEPYLMWAEDLFGEILSKRFHGFQYDSV